MESIRKQMYDSRGGYWTQMISEKYWNLFNPITLCMGGVKVPLMDEMVNEDGINKSDLF